MGKPLQEIKMVENSIWQLKMKIQSMNKQRGRQRYKLDKLLDRSIPKILVKIKDAVFHVKKCSKIMEEEGVCKSQAKQVRDRRQAYEKQGYKSRDEILAERLEEGLHLKSVSRVNEGLVRQRKLEEIERKRVKKAKVRQMEQRSKEKINEFHIQKKKYLMEKRVKESDETQSKVRALKNRLQTLHLQEAKLYKIRFQESQDLKRFRQTMTRLERSSPEEVVKLQEGLNKRNFSNKDHTRTALLSMNSSFNISDQ